MSFTSINHYVPQWYQRRFYVDKLKENKVYYLDLTPDKIKIRDGVFIPRKAIRRLGTKECFKQEHLYTIFFKNYATDEIEKRFFGAIDTRGQRAVEFFSDYKINGMSGQAFQYLMPFMDAQKLRTPKGLDFIKYLSGERKPHEVLVMMQKFWQIHITIWTEGVWEVVECQKSQTKFIMSVSFTTGIYIGNDKGPTWAQDEYGRRPNDNDPEVQRKRKKEWNAFHAFQKSWDSMYGALSTKELQKFD